MNLSPRQRRFSNLSVIMLLAIAVLTACGSSSTSAASCAFVIGNGENGSDRSLRNLVFPGQKVDVGENEKVLYFPCNSRNTILNDGSDGQVGDRTVPIRAYTSTGTAIDVSLTAFWTVNQDPEAMRQFYNPCHKHTCASDDENAGNVNNSTEGWIDMQNENIIPALETTTQFGTQAKDANGVPLINDSIWRTHDVEQYRILADYVSANFDDNLRTRFGYQEDLFCGSGNSNWTDPSKPGEGEFTCNNVRIEVTSVNLADVGDDGSEGTGAVNAQRLDNAEELYGDNAEYWLGVQDTVEQCKDSGVTCVFNIGDSSAGSPGVSVPVTTPTPTPEPPQSEEEEGEG